MPRNQQQLIYIFRCDLESLKPDTRALQASDITDDVRGVIVTVKGQQASGDYDFLSRYFAPWNGIPEDPVTGNGFAFLRWHIWRHVVQE